MLLYRLDKMPVLDFQPDCLFPVCHLIRSLLLELRLGILIRLTTMSFLYPFFFGCHIKFLSDRVIEESKRG
jgi:hypothetical protein